MINKGELMKKILKLLTNKIFIIGVLVIIQLLVLFYLIQLLGSYSQWIVTVLNIFSILVLIHVVNSNENPSYKQAWSILVLMIPMFGSVVYLIFGGKKIPKKLRGSAMGQAIDGQVLQQQDEAIMDQLKALNPYVHKQNHYLTTKAFCPVYKNTKTQYYGTGEETFEAMIAAISKATSFIFLEYFIIKEGYMWDTIKDILVEKVKQGVKVRLMYDDVGSVLLPSNFAANLRKQGIEVIVFNPLVPMLAIFMNNRDHRKILVVDGLIGFVGGVNIADEYINKEVRFGHWKDCSVAIEGDGVWSLTCIFLQVYRYYSKTKEDVMQYKVAQPAIESDGFVQPFLDSPTDSQDVSETIYLNMINQAKQYVYIITPYLVIGYEMILALCNAAKSGIDVRIILPYIPDKRTVNEATKSNYKILCENHIRIYEYKPGFIHSKVMVSDDETAIIGTTNMDYRSYYMHFECGIYFVNSKAVNQSKQDFMETLKVCKEITLEEINKTPFIVVLARAVINLFQGLM